MNAVRRTLEPVRLISIGNDCWLNSDSIVRPGVMTGADIVTGTGSVITVVTKDMPAYALAVGNPVSLVKNLFLR